MKALIKNEEAQAGVGTLIIFIAMVLVAAVAAAVLMTTQGSMNAKSTLTTSQSAAAITENLNFVSIYGVNNGAALTGLNITLQVAPGGSAVDLSKVLVIVQGVPFNYSNATSATQLSTIPNTFGVYALRPSSPTDPSLGTTGTWYSSTATPPTLNSGALARLDVNVSGLNPSLGPKTSVSIVLTPEKGASVSNPVTLPAFTTSTISIYP